MSVVSLDAAFRSSDRQYDLGPIPSSRREMDLIVRFPRPSAIGKTAVRLFSRGDCGRTMTIGRSASLRVAADHQSDASCGAAKWVVCGDTKTSELSRPPSSNAYVASAASAFPEADVVSRISNDG